MDKELKLLLKAKIWRTSNDEMIRIKDLSTLHLLNIKHKIIRDEWREPYLPLIKNELKSRKSLNSLLTKVGQLVTAKEIKVKYTEEFIDLKLLIND